MTSARSGEKWRLWIAFEAVRESDPIDRPWKQLKKATRGCDFATQLAGAVFLAALWDCPVGSVRRVLERVSPLVLDCGGKEIPVACSAAWVDYQAGEAPAEMIARAEHMLQLYQKADQAAASPV